MLLEVLDRGLDELEGDELVAALLEAADDLADEACRGAEPESAGALPRRECETRRTALDTVRPASGRRETTSASRSCGSGQGGKETHLIMM